MIDYDPHRWTRNILAVRGSMLREISLRVLSCALLSVIVTWVHLRVRPIGISDKPHVFIGVSLGLLLVFRTNASYDRYWEGRKLWGSITNEVRNLVRRTAVYLANEPAQFDRFVRLLIAFPYATMNHLRGEKNLGRATAVLPPGDVEKAHKSAHVPLFVSAELSQVLAQALKRGVLSDITHTALEDGIASLVSCLGGCERIVQTPLPFPYVVHLRRALVIYCFSLPFALVDSLHWMNIAATTLLTYMLFGIEEIGVEIENPFEKEENDLPLERICERIEGNLRPFLIDKPGAKRADIENA